MPSQKRSWMWMIAEAACEEIVTASMRSTHVPLQGAQIDGLFRRMLMPSEAETARSAGTMPEKTNDVPLIRW